MNQEDWIKVVNQRFADRNSQLVVTRIREDLRWTLRDVADKRRIRVHTLLEMIIRDWLAHQNLPQPGIDKSAMEKYP